MGFIPRGAGHAECVDMMRVLERVRQAGNVDVTCGSVTQVLWTFSIYLEAVAILPQLVLLQRTQNIDNLTGNYVFLLGCVRARVHGLWRVFLGDKHAHKFGSTIG